MAFFDWKPSYSVKVQSCDKDHQKLISLINDLYEAMKGGQGAQLVQQAVLELEQYTRFHFSSEEALMAKASYPALAAHRAEHENFVQKVSQFRKDLANGPTGQAALISMFLKDWLTNHILRTDQQYSDHLNAKGIC